MGNFCGEGVQQAFGERLANDTAVFLLKESGLARAADTRQYARI